MRLRWCMLLAAVPSCYDRIVLWQKIIWCRAIMMAPCFDFASIAANYLLRPDALEDCCAYCMVMNYAVVQAGSKRSEKSQKYIGRELYFQEEHPSKKRSHMRELKRIQIPLIYTKREMPSISELEVDSSTPSSNAEMQREYYAKLSLLLLYPFRDFSELKHEDGSFWSKYIWAKKTGKLWNFDPKNF
mmetsp:Transcript_16087/g.32379  ORF Transcript_16087/g.32379 Transcript_16087/m.32379 type:complete len:187 (+) Transcript_16087:1882-2442(+)